MLKIFFFFRSLCSNFINNNTIFQRIKARSFDVNAENFSECTKNVNYQNGNCKDLNDKCSDPNKYYDDHPSGIPQNSRENYIDEIGKECDELCQQNEGYQHCKLSNGENDTEQLRQKGISTGILVCIIIASVVFLFFVGFFIYYYIYKIKNAEEVYNESDNTP